MDSLILSNSMFAGAAINNITFGLLSTHRLYFFYNYRTSNTLLAYFSLFSNFVYFSIDISKWFTLGLGIGGVWNVLEYLFITNGRADYGGPAFYIKMLFNTPFKYINFEINNFLDISFRNDILFLINTGTIGINFYPGLSWLRLFFQFSGVYWFSHDKINTAQNGQFLLQSGLAFELSFPELVKKIPEFKKNEHNIKIDTINTEQSKYPELDEYLSNFIQELERAPVSSIINIEGIIFVDNGTQLAESSKELLYLIANSLLDNLNVVFAIGGYTFYSGNPEVDMRISIERSKTIISALTDFGITSENMKILGSANIIDTGLGSDNQTSPKIIFKIVAR